MLVKARLAYGPDWEARRAWLAGGRWLSTSALHALWMAAGCCQPRCWGPTGSGSAGGGPLWPVRVSHEGGSQSQFRRACAAATAARMAGGAFAGLHSCWVMVRAKLGSCRWRTGRVSAQDPQCAALALMVAAGKPNPPSDKGK